MPPKKKAAPRTTRRSFGRLRQFRSGRWKASYTGPDGKLHEAPHTFAAQIDAEAWLTDRRRELDRDMWSPPPTTAQKKTHKRTAVTFSDYAQQWVDNRLVKGKPLAPRTKSHYGKLLAQHINPTFGTKPVATITRDDVDNWYRGLDAGTPTTRAHCYSLLKAVLETAVTVDKLLDANPCVIAGAGQADRKVKPQPLDHTELSTLVTSMPERFRAMTLLAAWGAMRFGELVELRRGDIAGDVVKIRRGAVRDGGTWIVGNPKSYAGKRDVVLPPNMIPALEHHLNTFVDKGQDALLFPADHGGHLQPSTLYRWFYKARTAAGRDDLRWHDLRHTGAVLAAQAGATLSELMERLGHSSPQAAMRYQHAARGRDRRIAELMAKALTDTQSD